MDGRSAERREMAQPCPCSNSPRLRQNRPFRPLVPRRPRPSLRVSAVPCGAEWPLWLVPFSACVARPRCTQALLATSQRKFSSRLFVGLSSAALLRRSASGPPKHTSKTAWRRLFSNLRKSSIELSDKGPVRHFFYLLLPSSTFFYLQLPSTFFHLLGRERGGGP